MSVHLGHLRLVAGAPAPAAEPGAASEAAPAAPAPARDSVTSDVLPPSPPAEVSEQVGAALQRAQDLFAANRELHFAKDPDTGRIVVEVRDLDGNVLRTIPPSEALEVMTGGTGL